MTKVKKHGVFTRVLALAAVIAALCCVIPSAASAEVEYYCRTAIAKLPNSAALIYAYDRIAEGVAAQCEKISVYNGVDALSADEIKTVYSAYQYDHTECFWLDSGCGISSNANTVLSVTPNYSFAGDALTKARKMFDGAVEDILSKIDKSASDFEKEKALHDILAQNTAYEISAKNAHNAYGALVEGEAVCEGYAKAFQYLLHRLGIQSAIVIGESRGVAHGWNIVKIDGDWYHVDLTWDDQNDNIYYAYFNKTDNAIKEDHVIYDVGFDMPECTATKYDYYEYSGTKISSFDAQKLAELLKSNGFTARIYVTGSTAEFKSALADGNNWLKIAGFAGVKCKFSVSYSSLGREFILGMTLSQPIDTGSSRPSDVSYSETSGFDEPSQFNETSDNVAMSSTPEKSGAEISSTPATSGCGQTSDISETSDKPGVSSQPETSDESLIPSDTEPSATSETVDISSRADQNASPEQSKDDITSAESDNMTESSALTSQPQNDGKDGGNTALIVSAVAACVITAAVIIIIKRK